MYELNKIFVVFVLDTCVYSQFMSYYMWCMCQYFYDWQLGMTSGLSDLYRSK